MSFYAIGSYTFDDRYSLTGSVRIDQSNLFGTDPKYQYRPLWSVGGSWQLANEEFMKDYSWINRLNLRVTYGIGGNIPKEAGPYMNITNAGYNEWVGDFGSYISNPPNSQLRWEKTTSTNVGLDFAILNEKIDLEIDGDQHYLDDRIAESDKRRDAFMARARLGSYQSSLVGIQEIDRTRR